MKSGWKDADALRAIERWGEIGEDFALRVYTSRLLGRDRSLVLHGGGNVSIKVEHETVLGETVWAIRVKGSGWDLADLEPAGLPVLELEPLIALLGLETLGDEAMVNEVRRSLFDSNAPTPSIETLVHAAVPFRFVDHSHPDALLAITNQPSGRDLISEALGDHVPVLPYVFPGFDLAKAMAAILQQTPDAREVVLMHHGLFTFGDDARSSYERHVEIVDRCERFLEKRLVGARLTVSFQCEEEPAVLASRIAPRLRGLLAEATGDEDRPVRLPILEWRATPEILEFLASDEVESLTASGPVTTDHLIRTGKSPCFVKNPAWSDDEALQAQLSEAIDRSAKEARSYRAKEGAGPSVQSEARSAAEDASPLPRVVLLPGAGAFCFGRTKRDARICADITEQSLSVKARAHLSGGYESLADDHIFAMEFRSLQLVKLRRDDKRVLAQRVVVISGGAGAIGAAIAKVCARVGAHVVVADISRERLDGVVADIERECGPGTAWALLMDVTDRDSVQRGFDEIARTYGGVDVVVPNAGIAHVAPVAELQLDDFKRVLDVNLVGYLLFIQAGVRILKEQGRGGHVVINASKNVFGPGKDFGAYSASKAAGHQLGKVSAIELAPLGIRVNMINADAVFGDKAIPSGLWEKVGPDRAKSRGLAKEDLPEYYRNRNLLKVRVYGHHVGNAVVYFASNQSPTTGATLPVDGGVVDAFPR